MIQSPLNVERVSESTMRIVETVFENVPTLPFGTLEHCHFLQLSTTLELIISWKDVLRRIFFLFVKEI